MVIQGTETKVEGVEQAEKQAEPIQSQEKPTGKTYTEEDFQRAVSKGLESMTKQLSLQQAESKRATSQLKVKETDLKSLQEDLAELEKMKLDDPEFRETYTSKRIIREAQREVDRAKAELEEQKAEMETQRWRARMDTRAIELVKETGIDINDFVGCHTEEEMEAKALRWEKANKGFAEKKEEKPPKFDSGMGSGGGIDLSQLSPKEKIDMGLEKLKKK